MPNWNSSPPFEIIASPAIIYLAPALTAAPSMSAVPVVVPTAPWVLLGTSGELNYAEDGVVIAMPQEIVKWKSLGDTGSRKAFRVGEDVTVRVKVVDLTLEQLQYALNDNAITAVSTVGGPGTAGSSKIGLSRGPGVSSYALVVRFPSPYDIDLWAQLWLPIAINEGATEFMFKKGDPAGLQLDFSAMVNAAAVSDDERFGFVEAQTVAGT